MAHECSQDANESHLGLLWDWDWLPESSFVDKLTSAEQKLLIEPARTVTSYTHVTIGSMNFRVQRLEDRLRTQDSGLAIKSTRQGLRYAQ